MINERIFKNRASGSACAARQGLLALIFTALLLSNNAFGVDADAGSAPDPKKQADTSEESAKSDAAASGAEEASQINAPAAEIDEAAKARAKDPRMIDYRAEASKVASERDKKMAKLTEISKTIEERKAQILVENEEAAELAASVAELEKGLAEKKAALVKIYMDDEKLLELQDSMDAARADLSRAQVQIRETIRRQHLERLSVEEAAKREREQGEKEKNGGE